MIDVFMLVDDNIVLMDPSNRAIDGVWFCERHDESYTEILDMLARTGSGFLGSLEEIALFRDDDYTKAFATTDAIIAERVREGEDITPEKLKRLRLKETSLLFDASFPYDFVNLDFCEYYYQAPPAVFTITETVGKFLELQRRTSPDADAVKIDDFMLAVTCRYDLSFPAPAHAFLANLVEENCTTWSEYDEAIRTSRGLSAREWIVAHKEDLFFSAWPKHIAQVASVLGWESEILDYVYYPRPADDRSEYTMVCLVVRFRRSDVTNDLLSALHALQRGNRVEIPDVGWESKKGRPLHAHLKKIRELRNQQARLRKRAELPAIE
jgi:hypothetical protein